MGLFDIEHWKQRLALFNAVPMGIWPTPVQFIETSGHEGFWSKREDLSSPIGGGNKVRKLKYLLVNAPETLVTFGAIGSNHVLATAVHASHLDCDCIGILTPQPMTEQTKGSLAHIMASCISVIRLDGPLEIARSLFEISKYSTKIPEGFLRKNGLRIIPPGGSNALGTLGFVEAGLELASQVYAGQCPQPDEIYVPLGTGGTSAGLALGLALSRVKTRVVAVRVASKLSGNSLFLRFLASRAFGLLAGNDGKEKMPPLNLSVAHGFAGRGYGHPTVEGKEAICFAKESGLSLETTYSAKALAALLHNQKNSRKGFVRMFLDTYGPIKEIVSLTSEKDSRQ